MILSISNIRGIAIGLTLLFSLFHSQCIIDVHHQQQSPRKARGLRHSPLSEDASDLSPVTIENVPSVNTTPNNGTIVVQLSGEMGNNLHKLAFARGLQLMAKGDYDLNLQLVLRHQEDSKWKSARRNLQKCFPNLRHFDFGAGNTREFEDQKLQQRLWLGPKADSLVLQGNQEENMATVLKNLHTILSQSSSTSGASPHFHFVPQQSETSESTTSKVTLPFILSDKMVDWHVLDRYRDELLEWLQFDYTTCCPSSLPDPDETVFHFRNFVTELKAVTSELGFDELSPSQAAHELLGHLQEGDKVAITTRFDNDITQQYVQSFQARGLHARVVAGNSATQDFCFLMKAQKELVGSLKSTFFTWAAFLGISDNNDDDDDHSAGIQVVRSYSVNPRVVVTTPEQDSDKRTRNYQESPVQQMPSLQQPPHHWKDTALSKKWSFQVFDVATKL